MSMAKMHPFNFLQYVICIFFILTIIEGLTLEIGEECTDTSNLKGTCKLLAECPRVIQLKAGNRKYTRCGFNGLKEVVCCAERTITKGPLLSELPDKRYVKECALYKSRVYEFENSYTPLTANSHVMKKTVSKCTDNTAPLVVSGENARPKEFPHMALLGCKLNNGTNIWPCGGTLISPNFVLTAAHCFEGNTQCNELNLVRLGELDIDSTTDDAQPTDFEVERTIIHPEYNDSIKYNDIALLKLKTNVHINSYMHPACLPYQDYNNVSQLIITGWGQTKFAGKSSSHLQKASIELFEHKECKEVFEEEPDEKWPVGVRERIQICAGPKKGTQDTCQGDSGGPLQIIHPIFPCMYTVIGVTSTGQACGVENNPAIYTRVFHYIDWIESVVWE